MCAERRARAVVPAKASTLLWPHTQNPDSHKGQIDLGDRHPIGHITKLPIGKFTSDKMSYARKVERGYGLSAELYDKIRAAYSAQDEAEILEWFGKLGLSACKETGHDAFHEYLQDGEVLCNFANRLQPGAIRKVNNVKAVKMAVFKASKAQENIGFFLTWAKQYGVPDSNTFQTAALYEATNLSAVQRAIYAVGSICGNSGFTPTIGAKLASSNKRDFSEEQLKAGDSVIGLQMGTNKHASQAGMTGYGTGRQIIDQGCEQRRGNTDFSAGSFQTGSKNNQGANQAGMTAPGSRRQIL